MRRFQYASERRRRERADRHVELERRMQKAGVVNGKGNPSRVAWYHDHRKLPEVQASYLGRLTQLRDDLILSEKDNLSKAMERLDAIHQSTKHTEYQKNALKPNMEKSESFPERHKRLQRERQVKLARRRHQKSPVALEPLKGEKMSGVDSDGMVNAIEEAEFASPRQAASNGLSWEEFNEILNDRDRLAADDVSALTGRSSIPNVGRRALRKVDLQRSDTFIRHMQIHDKDSKGIYRGTKKRNILHADSDYTSLYPEYYGYDIPKPSPRSISTLSHDQSRLSTTPRPYHVTTNSSPSTYRLLGYQGAFNMRNPRHILAHNNSKVLFLQKRHPYHPAHTDSTPRGTNSDTVPLSSPTQDRIISQHRSHVVHSRNGTREKHGGCVFCANPELTMIPTGLDQFVMLDAPRNSPDIPDFSDLLPPDTRLTESADEPEIPSPASSRKKLVVEMPNLVLNSPSPASPYPYSVLPQVSLTKTMKQNELRCKEVNNLLTDVQELNRLSDDLSRQSVTMETYVDSIL